MGSVWFAKDNSSKGGLQGTVGSLFIYSSGNNRVAWFHDPVVGMYRGVCVCKGTADDDLTCVSGGGCCAAKDNRDDWYKSDRLEGTYTARSSFCKANHWFLNSDSTLTLAANPENGAMRVPGLNVVCTLYVGQIRRVEDATDGMRGSTMGNNAYLVDTGATLKYGCNTWLGTLR